MTLLTMFQRLMIRYIKDSGATAVAIAGRWVSVLDIKNDARLAEACWAIVG